MPAPVAPSRTWTRWMGAMVGASLLIGQACGSGSPDAEGAAAGEAETVSLPAVEVHDVSAGTEVALTSLLPSDRPVLLWFWAPH